jgi:predicted RNA-binding Zn-ribbon protein involved in translation (DUF1610 family)
MSNTKAESARRCSSCGFSLSEEAHRIGVCETCGAVLNLEHLRSKQQEVSGQEAAGRGEVFAEWFAAAFGLMMIAGGVVLICSSAVGPPQLLSGWCITASILTIATVVHRLVEGETIYPAPLLFGLV